MFSSNKKGMGKSNETESFQRNQVAKGTKITGDIDTNGSIRIDGELTGTLKSSGKVVIGETGRVEGEIICQTASFSGKLKGKVTVSELLTLHATAAINGDIITGKLAIEPGATFTGNCSMGAVIKEMSHDKQGSKQKQA